MISYGLIQSKLTKCVVFAEFYFEASVWFTAQFVGCKLQLIVPAYSQNWTCPINWDPKNDAIFCCSNFLYYTLAILSQHCYDMWKWCGNTPPPKKENQAEIKYIERISIPIDSEESSFGIVLVTHV